MSTEESAKPKEILPDYKDPVDQKMSFIFCTQPTSRLKELKAVLEKYIEEEGIYAQCESLMLGLVNDIIEVRTSSGVIEK